ncbi:caspase-1-A-like isoform X2 [Scomber scombrus]|uniref:caspase-1-A-like isoform X2 n=1 Tax=Scomber scombrus TaxID=13677 RepID=UPI002DDB2F61|nr:caspase-1-A-like isoform X2 [Scomber scombrus]
MADKELAKVRTKFAEGVNIAVIKQLLDDVLEDGIVNDGEKESILEENSTKTDKARALIDTVKRKGDEASRKLITRLYNRDPTLHKNLGLSSGQPAQPAPEPQMDEEWSTTLKPTTDAFWREKLNDRSTYTVTKDSIRSRVALLITNIEFTDKAKIRKGADKDEENMEKLLKALGYEVVKCTNLTGKEIKEAVIKFSKHPKLKETDSVFVVIMSHGELGAFPIDDIYKHLDTAHCQDLLNKPKIIIIQACSGEKDGSVLVSDAAVVSDDAQQPDPSLSAGEENIEDDALRRAPKEKDFIRFRSSTPGTVSHRNDDEGSFFIQYIVEVLNTYAHKDHIEELFRKVTERFEDFSVSTERIDDDTQIPNKDRCTLSKKFYLFPGLWDRI